MTHQTDMTDTEAEALFAQIIDRLARATHAQAEKSRRHGEYSADISHHPEEAVESEIHSKHRLPRGVYLPDWPQADPSRIVATLKPYIRHWVRGELSEEEALRLMAWMERVYDLDYGWVFFEQPLYRYECSRFGHGDQKAVQRRFVAFGTRSGKRHMGTPFTRRFYLGRP